MADWRQYQVKGGKDPRAAEYVQPAQPAQPQPVNLFDDVVGKATKGLSYVADQTFNPLAQLGNVYEAGKQLASGTGDILGGAARAVGDVAQGNFQGAASNAGTALMGAGKVAGSGFRALPVIGGLTENMGTGMARGATEALSGVGNVAGGLYNFGKGAITAPGSTKPLEGMQQAVRGASQIISSPFTAGMSSLPTGAQETLGGVMQPVAQAGEGAFDAAVGGLMQAAGLRYDPQSPETQKLKQVINDSLTVIGGISPATATGKQGIKTAQIAGKDFGVGVKGVVGGAKDVKNAVISKLPTFKKQVVNLDNIDDALAEGAKVGLKPQDIRNIVTAKPAVKDLLRKQLNIAESTKDATGRIVPVQAKEVAGKQFVQGAKVLNQKNVSFIKAKKQLIEGLGDKKFDLTPARANTVKALDKYGVKVNPKTAELDFSKSRFAESPKSQKMVQNMYNKVLDNVALTARDIDTMKKAFGDEIFGGTQKGLYTEAVKDFGKEFYFGLDDAISKVNPAYRKLNSQISDVSEVLTEVNKLLGNKNIGNIDLKQLKAGEKLNTLLTNMAGNNKPIIERFIKTSQKYGGKVDMDTINRTTSMASLLEELLPTQTSSLTSGVKKGTMQATREIGSDVMKATAGGTLGRLEVAGKYLSGAGKDLTTQQVELLKKLLATKKAVKAPVITTPKATKVQVPKVKPPIIKNERVNNLYTTLKVTPPKKTPKVKSMSAKSDNGYITLKAEPEKIAVKPMKDIDLSLMSRKQKADYDEWTGLLQKYKGDAKKIKLIKQQIESLPKVAEPPKVMYHGTSESNAQLIKKDGFKSGKTLGRGEKRQYISLGSSYVAGTYTRGVGKNTKIPVDISNLKLKAVSHTDPLREGIENGTASIPKGYDGLQIMFKNSVAEVVIPADIATKNMKL